MSSSSERKFTRVQVRYRGRLGIEVGVFVAVDHLRRAGVLDAHQENQYLDINDWFEENLPNPPFYEDGNTIGAVTWFKVPLPDAMAHRVEALQAILHAHGVEHDVVFSNDPGEVVYEDEFQIGVVPLVRGEMTPMPEGLALGPTSAGSIRKFLQGQKQG